MSTPVTAAEVLEGSDVWTGDALCHVTSKTVDRKTGKVNLSWTENFFGHEATFGGSFMANEHFGEVSSI